MNRRIVREILNKAKPRQNLNEDELRATDRYVRQLYRNLLDFINEKIYFTDESQREIVTRTIHNLLNYRCINLTVGCHAWICYQILLNMMRYINGSTLARDFYTFQKMLDDIPKQVQNFIPNNRNIESVVQ